MKLLKYIANLGYGSRRNVQAMFDDERICNLAGHPLSEKSSCAVSDIIIDGQPIDPPPGVVLMLHKPVGYTCSTKDPNHVVYDLLPKRFRERSPIIAPVGRLDRQTSGLLLLTDDGQLQHRITSPKRHLKKTYRVEFANALQGHEVETFASGKLMLEGEDTPLLPAEMRVLGANLAELVITEGRYHQVRRMFAAVGNHVEQLHRSQMGQLTLGALQASQWCLLSEAELALVFAPT